MTFNWSKVLQILKDSPAEVVKVGGVVVGVLAKNPALIPELITVATSGNVGAAISANPKVIGDLAGAIFAEVQADPAVLGALATVAAPFTA